jgi:hypothetical protein
LRPWLQSSSAHPGVSRPCSSLFRVNTRSHGPTARRRDVLVPLLGSQGSFSASSAFASALPLPLALILAAAAASLGASSPAGLGWRLCLARAWTAW